MRNESCKHLGDGRSRKREVGINLAYFRGRKERNAAAVPW